MFRAHWWAAVATVTRHVGDLEIAEDAVQDACVAAMHQWGTGGVPRDPHAWLVTVARRRAVDRIRREMRRGTKEEQAVRREPAAPSPPGGGDPPDFGAAGDDQLGLIFLCCHPALDQSVRVPLTLRSVCGLTTGEIAAAFLTLEPTMAQRLVRAKRKIRDAGIPFRVPAPSALPERLSEVLCVLYVVFTAGHRATSGPGLVRGDLCDEAVRLARVLATLLPDEAEVTGLLALLLLTDARRDSRLDASGEVVLLEDQDRQRWDRAKIVEGNGLVEKARRAGRPGSYQVQAEIAACHANAPTAADTDWRRIATLYHELLRFEPTAVVEANRAVAVAMAEGPIAGLVILDALRSHQQLSDWPQLHMARAGLLARAGRPADARDAYLLALQLEPPPAERAFIARRLDALMP